MVVDVSHGAKKVPVVRVKDLSVHHNGLVVELYSVLHHAAIATNYLRKVRRLALQSAFSSKVKEENIIVLESLSLDAPKTKEVVSMLSALDVNEKVLIVTADQDENVTLSANNIPTAKALPVEEVNVLDLLTHDKLILTKEAAEKAGEVLS